MLSIGDVAPDLEVLTHLGVNAPLSDYWAKGRLILFFYPKDQTRICTKEVCSLQASLAEFAGFDAQVLGASTDSVESHKRFAAANGLEFPLISDRGGRLAKAYQARRPIIGICKRITYVIGTDGRIQAAVHDEFNVSTHLDRVRKLLAG